MIEAVRITAANLTKRYRAVPAVDDLSFELRPGMVTGLLGPSGAGKSTVVRLMVGLDRGDGETLFDGVPYESLRDPIREVGVVLQTSGFHPGRRIRAHLRMVAASHRLGRRRVDEVLEWVGLTAVADRRPRDCSPGTDRRLALGAALLGDPRALILDDPTDGLDPAGIAWLHGFLRSLAAEGRTVLVAGDQLGAMSVTTDHLIVIGAGRLVADEPTPVFVARSAKAGTIIVRTPHLERLSRVLVQAGAVVLREQANLLAVTGMTPGEIGEHAFRHEIVLHELAPRVVALQDTFLELAVGDPPAGPLHPPGTARIPVQSGSKESVR